ncbi:MAG TPA: helix-turn-helix domain-containing protein [Croceibacterium sp.]|nr:helix-turn-helix domain-containing protein [Croceibacterium sp.]
MDGSHASFAVQVARVRDSGLVGYSGRLRDLFEFLAARGPEGEPATQADIAETVFGQRQAEADDATARVYIHRLRKRLEQFYAGRDDDEGRLIIPAGAYALRFERGETTLVAPPPRKQRRWLIPVVALAALVAAFFAGHSLTGSANEPKVNAIWRPFVESERPIVIVIGDYYIYGESDGSRPEVNKLVRDFSINSKTDLARAQEADPHRYGNSEDMGLDYLPVSSAYALRSLMPVLARNGKPVTVMPASQLDSQTFRTSNVIYVGLISGMGMLQDVSFANSNFAVGETFDELVDMESGRRYTSGEAFALTTPRYYQDYGYIARFREPGGALVGIVAGERDTGLRGAAPLAVSTNLPDKLQAMASSGKSFEALYQITGQQGADLGEKLEQVRSRP